MYNDIDLIDGAFDDSNVLFEKMVELVHENHRRRKADTAGFEKSLCEPDQTLTEFTKE